MTKQANIAAGKFWDRPWSLVDGCTPVSPGCDRCWSAAMANRFKPCGGTLTTDGKYNGTVNFRSDRLELPLKVKAPTVWSIWTDLFHENFKDSIFLTDQTFAFSVMHNCPQHVFLILTKRPQLAFECTDNISYSYWSDNIWLGTSIESPDQLDRIEWLLRTPVLHRFINVEPMLAEIDLRPYIQLWGENGTPEHIEEHGWGYSDWSGGFIGPEGGDSIYDPRSGIDLVICGPETGSGARFCNPAWIKNLYDQCRAAEVPFFDKSKRPLARELPWVNIK